MTTLFHDIADHAPTVVACAAIAMLATYVALELAGRVRRSYDRLGAKLWALAGSIAMGSGIWATHFVGISGAAYPFRAAYETGMTLASWIVAVLASAAFLAFAARPRATLAASTIYALLAGGGAVLMHYIGTEALVLSSGAIVYDLRLVAAATVTMIVGTGIALRTFDRLRTVDGWAMVRRQLLVSGIYGAALGAMHCLAMMSIECAAGAVCAGHQGLELGILGEIVGFAALTFLGLVLMMTMLDRRSDARTRRLDQSVGRARDELHRVTFNDQVTGLPNRIVFQDRLRQAVARCDRADEVLAVLFVDLDGTGVDGHAWTDPGAIETLRRIATRLVEAGRLSDTVAAVGDHQFLVMMDGINDVQPAVQVAERIAMALRDVGRAGDDVTDVTASIGIAMYPADGTLASLVGAASKASSEACASGGNGYRFFEATMNVTALDRSALLGDLRRAVARNELSLHYQPKMDGRTGAIAGVEALLRWHHPTRGLVGPDVFIPLAEQFGLIGELGAWVIDAACRQIAAWTAGGIRMPVAINVSVRQLRDGELATLIAETLASNRIDPAMLTCEITESAAMDNTQATLSVLQQLRAVGIGLSIDDFGTGHSSLSYLRTLPVRQLKIDRSFVGDLESVDGRSIVAAVIDLAHALRLEVVAEGVETEAQKNVLDAMGCDQLQGFLFSRPVPAALLPLGPPEARASQAQGVESPLLAMA